LIIFDVAMPVNQPRISVAILAGGANRRFGGELKALMQWEGVPIIEQYLRVLNPLTDDLLVISNTPEVLSFCNARVYPDLIPGHGPLSGIHAAISYALHQHIMIVACDMPFLPAHLIPLIFQEAITNPGKVIIPRHAGGLEPMFSCWPKGAGVKLGFWLKESNNNKILRFVEDHALMKTANFADQPIENHMFMNINTQDDYLIATALMEARSGKSSA
jgi:molybdenum cofactor guanylyltransferase